MKKKMSKKQARLPYGCLNKNTEKVYSKEVAKIFEYCTESKTLKK